MKEHGPGARNRSCTEKKANVREDLEVFPHVGLLIIEPPGRGPRGTRQVALYLVIRRRQLIYQRGGLEVRCDSPLHQAYQAEPGKQCGGGEGRNVQLRLVVESASRSLLVCG